MRFSDLRPAIVHNIEAGISTHLASPPGVGKSDFVEDLIKWLNKRDGEGTWGFVTCFLATFSPTDLMGYMVPTKIVNPDGSQALASVFTTPSWMMTAPSEKYPHGRHINTYKRGIVFLDEWSQADGDTKKAAAQLKLKGEIGPHKLHKGISVISAGNRSSDRSGVTKEFDFVINREQRIDITPDLVSWQNWAIANNVTPLTIAFATSNPNIMFGDEVPKEQGPWTTPRSMCMADRLLQQYMSVNGGEIPNDPALAEQLHGMMGPGAAQYLAHMKLAREMPKYDEIVRDPKGAKLPKAPDAQMLVCYSLAHQIKPKDATPVVEYIDRLDKEFAVTFATTACKKQPMLVAEDAFDKWARKNSSLMAAIALSVKQAAA